MCQLICAVHGVLVRLVITSGLDESNKVCHSILLRLPNSNILSFDECLEFSVLGEHRVQIKVVEHGPQALD